jgi:transketolase
MRVEFAQSIISAYCKNKNLVFVTGDLGYMALEKVQETFGEHFINAGVAEQNMVTVAAALAQEGFCSLDIQHISICNTASLRADQKRCMSA